ncbi:hypothetical protein [Pseudochryseolinea flava]|uniref:Uncharacterized protein n=1 Tax=Pseudochryseolinea flava TaxID=2059302 RepID=A0A364Y2D1_9BACT|nr:hypothetical protein [Pseudochryseolinea flava]RAW00849.1 hypothetical protein DQQ10_11430 [Pseudochryseolinea flava]
MKKFKIILLMMMIGTTALCQTLYYEAKTLKRIVGNSIEDYDYPSSIECQASPFSTACGDYAMFLEILRKYAPDSLKKATNKMVIEHYKKTNPFFSALSDPTNEVSGAERKGLGGLLSSAVSSVGGIDVTAFADGLAQFLVERTKEELNVTFFEKLKKLLDDYPEFAVVFPNTQVFLENFESWQYANLITTMREAFHKDLNAILSNLIELRDLKAWSCPEKSKTCKARVEELEKFFATNEGLIMLSAFQFGNALQGNMKMVDAINGISSKEFLLGITNSDSIVQRDFRNSVQLLNIMNMSLRSVEIGRNYISNAEFQELVSDQTLQKLFLGLFYEQVSVANIRFGADNISVASILVRANNLKRYFELILQEQEDFITAVHELQSKKQSGKAVAEDYVAVYDAGNMLLQTILNFQVIDASIPRTTEMDKFFTITNSVSSISHDIVSKNYHAAVVSILKLFDDQVKRQGVANLDDFKSSFLNYATFGANVVKSESPEDVKKAIKAVALPAGSSSIKKTTDFNVALNAYVGFVYGEDRPAKDRYTTTDANGNSVDVKLNGGKALAIYAPVGITVSKGMLFSKRNPWSLSAFISMIDVGALVGYRFTNDSTSTVSSEVKFANIFAPGGNIAIGLPWVPISIGYGFQFIPSLQRNPSDNSLYKVDYSGWRNNQFFISVDIPLVNLYTGKKYMLSKRRSVTNKKKQ